MEKKCWKIIQSHAECEIEDEGCPVVKMPHLQELPDHQRLEHRPDAAGNNDKGIRHEHELVEPCSKVSRWRWPNPTWPKRSA